MATSARDQIDASTLKTARLLLDIAEGDTVFRDLYLRRATTRLRTLLPEADYRQLKGLQPQIDNLLAQIRPAVQRGAWDAVKDLSLRAENLRNELQKRSAELAVAEAVYEAPPVSLDPFSPGLGSFGAARGEAPGTLRDRMLATFAALAEADTDFSEVYRKRRGMFASLKIVEQETSSAASDAGTDRNTLMREAQQAAERGDVSRLQQLADELAKPAQPAVVSPTPGAATTAGSTMAPGPSELDLPFPEDSVQRAAELGLTAVDIRPRYEAVPAALGEFLARYAWEPSVPTADLAREGIVRLREELDSAGIPKDASEPLADLIALFSMHPFVNSGGVRYLGLLSPETVLVEDFPETENPPEESKLLSSLGLPSRSGRCRLEIERALQRHGVEVLQQLGLDPLQFRLLCIPYDVYVRAGQERGWGNQPRWTHVDGYQVIRGGRLRSLVAGDVRYGGLMDLVSISAEDQRESVIARFAVVRRARMKPGFA